MSATTKAQLRTSRKFFQYLFVEILKMLVPIFLGKLPPRNLEFPLGFLSYHWRLINCRNLVCRDPHEANYPALSLLQAYETKLCARHPCLCVHHYRSHSYINKINGFLHFERKFHFSFQVAKVNSEEPVNELSYFYLALLTEVQHFKKALTNQPWKSGILKNQKVSRFCG